MKFHLKNAKSNKIMPITDEEELKLVARALLPDMIREGSLLKYEMLQYEIM